MNKAGCQVSCVHSVKGANIEGMIVDDTKSYCKAYNDILWKIEEQWPVEDQLVCIVTEYRTKEMQIRILSHPARFYSHYHQRRSNKL